MLKQLLAAAAVVILLFPAAAQGKSNRSDASLLREVNRVREQHGLGKLRADSRLRRAARSHSREMIQTNAFEHGAFGNRMARFNVTGHLAGENLAWGTGASATARAIVAAWLASPEHRANLLRRSFTRVGVSDLVANFLGYSGAHVVTADFAG